MFEPVSRCGCIGSLLLLTLTLCTGSPTAAQDAEPLPLILQYDAGGIDNIVKAIQWSADGKTLYAAGWNKVVQVYHLDEATQEFRYLPQQNFRIPVATGRSGIIEAMVVSPSGRTLVVAGSAWSGVSSTSTGYVWPRSSGGEKDWQQIGSIYVFDTVTRACRVFRGHKGAVRQLTFVDNGKEPTQLVSLGFEYSGQKISQSVRLWSLETGEQIGQPFPLAHALIHPSTDISPRIQSWESVPGAVHIAVAAWRVEGTTPVSDLMIWNPLQNGDPRKLAGAPVSLALQTIGQGASRRLFCGGMGAATLFSVGDGQQISSQPVVGLPNDSTPFAAAAMPAADGSASARIAVVSVQQLPSEDKAYQLSVQDGSGYRALGSLWINHSTAPIPAATLIEPVVAASPDGRFLSAAGSTDNGIRIYRISDLLRIRQPAGELKPLQILTGRLLRPDSAVFVRRDEDIGIAVSTADGHSLRSIHDGNAIPPETVVVDSVARTATPGTSGWIADRSETGQWQTRLAADHHRIEVSDGSSESHILRVPSDYRADGFQESVTAHTVCSQHKKNPPLAAVATHVQGEPFLHIYDSRTGQCLRMLQSHERRITDLAFSADGRLLLSAALDGTVRGWMIEDLSTATIGQVGWLRGLFAETVDSQLRIDRVEAESSAAQAGVRLGDVISGILSDGQFESIHTSGEFYLRISQTSPELHKNITLRLRRADQTLDIAVPLEQGMDLREPLFSLLLSSLDDEQVLGAQQWLTWSPLGQFDVQGPRLEQQLGWHINTKDDAAPVRFSSIEQYRDRFLQEGLLQQLLSGSKVSVRKAVPPDMRLSVITASGEVLSPNYEDELVLRESDGQLILEIEDPSGDLVDTADWSVAGELTRQFSLVERDVWKSPVSASDLGRDQHLVHVRIVTNDIPPLEYTRTLFLRYQPDAPKIKLESPAQALSAVRSERLLLQAAVNIAVKADITVVHEFPNGERSEFSSELMTSGKLTRELILKPGRNAIRIQAKNSAIPASLSEYASKEVTSVETVIEYAPVGPPRIVIEEVRQTDQTGLQSAVVINGKLRVDVPEITILGRMESDELLQKATLLIEEKQTTLNGFKANVNRVAEFSETIQLKPGEQQVVFSGSAGGAEGSLPVEIVFQPPLPDIALITPVDRDVIIDTGDFDGSLHLESQVDDVRKYPFDYQVIVDDQVVDASAVSLDADTGLLSGDLPLTSDSSCADDLHRIELRLTNQWGRSSTLPLTVRFKHSPKLLSAVVKREEGTALADIICHVESSLSRPVSGMGLRVNGVEIHAVTFGGNEAADSFQDITLPGVALAEGANRIELHAVNRDGRSNAILVNEVIPPAPKKAEIRLIRPLVSLTSSQPLQPVAFAVSSEPGLQLVDLVVERDFREPQRISLLGDIESLQPVPDRAISEKRFEHLLPLTAGANRVRIEVRNRGGVTAQDFAITYLPPPVSISLEQLLTADAVSVIHAAENFIDNPAFEGSVVQGTTTLVGRIRWIPGHRPAGKNWTIRVWVNGFLKTLKVPAPAEGTEQAEFKVPLILNLSKNRLRIEAPEITSSHQKLAIDDHSVTALQNVFVSCTEPEQRQRLHLVLMGVQMEHGRNVCRAADLTEAAAAALRIHTPETAFASVKSYTTLVGEKAIGRNLRTMMVLIEAEISQQRLASGINDVVMFYYRGREYRSVGGEFLLEDFQNYENPVEHPQSISESYLAGLFEHLPGAHVVFLDIENAQNELSASLQWPRFPNLGLFRVAWSGKKPLPNPPGPLFSALQVATDVSKSKVTASLGTIQELLRTQLPSSTSDSRFVLETFVPDDLLQLVIARSP